MIARQLNQAPGRRGGQSGRRWLVAATVGILIVMAGGCSSDDPPANDLGFPEPEPAAVVADQAFLAGDGTALIEVHRLAGKLATSSEPGVEDCQVVVDALGETIAADEMFELTGAVADPVLAEAFRAQRVALGTTLTACIQGTPAEVDLAAAVDAVEVRLAQLDVDR